MHAEELPGLAAAVAEAGEQLQGVALHDVDALVAPVGDEEVRLLRVARERDVPDGAVASRVLRDDDFLHERAVAREHLNPVVGAVADVHEAVVRDLRAVHRIAELLRRRRLRVVGPQIGVVGLVAVGAPVALERAGVGVDHDDALVAIAVGDVGFVRRRIDEDLRGAPEVLRVVAAGVLSRMTHLQQELAVLVNLRMCASFGSLPPIQTLPLWSTVMPWLVAGHS